MKSVAAVPSSFSIRKYLVQHRNHLLLGLVGCLGYLIFLTQYDRVFPASALSLDLSRAEIQARAGEILADYGYNVAGYTEAVRFKSENTYYLETQLGIPATNALIRSEQLPLWAWQVRWFKPLQEEEFMLSLAPDGRVVGFEHRLPETQQLPNLGETQAQALAVQYLSGRLGWEMSRWELVSASSVVRPGGRRDHAFEWKRLDFSAGESELRLTVGITGNQVGSYRYWLKTPEAFWRKFDEQSERADFVDTWSTLIGLGGFALAGAAAAVWYSMRGGAVSKAWLPLALLAGATSLLSNLNLLPVFKAYYVTTQPFNLFWLETVGSLVLYALLPLCEVGVFMMGALAWNKIVWPMQDMLLPRGQNAWIKLSESAWRGLALAGIQCAYVIGFYYLATQLLGGWSPMQTSYSDLFATPFPFLAPIETGLIPALEEELVFRLLGIAALLWVTRRKDLAVIIPAVLWALAHLTYVREPFYMRGIELTVVGIFYGVIFLRYGLATTIVAHAAYNALLGALPLLRSPEPYFIVSGVIVLVAIFTPALIGPVLRLFKRTPALPAAADALVRPFHENDLPALARLLGEAPELMVPFSRPETIKVCAEQHGQVIGAAAGEIDADRAGHLLAVYVHPDYRQQYLGTRLVRALKEQLGAAGAVTIFATLPVEDGRAIAMLASLGWTTSHRTLQESEFTTFKALVARFLRKAPKDAA